MTADWSPPACPEHDRACDPFRCPVLWPPVVIPELVAARDRKRLEAMIRRAIEIARPRLRVVGGADV